MIYRFWTPWNERFRNLQNRSCRSQLSPSPYSLITPLKLLLFLLALTPLFAAQDAKKLPDRALCVVCALKGETEAEKVRASSDYNGNTYYFCAEGCKSEFEQDPTAYLPPMLPRPAPAVVMETLDSRDATLQDYAGKLILLDFWASWCAPCLKAMPDLQAFYELHQSRDFVVLGVSIDEGKGSLEKIEKVRRKRGITYPLLWDAKVAPAWNAFKVKAIPAMFLIDPQGQIVAQWTGKFDHREVLAEVKRRLKEN